MLIYGVEMPEMADHEEFLPLDMIVVIKGLNENGDIKYREMSSTGLSPMERLGMAVSYADSMRSMLMRGARGTGDGI